MEKKGGGESCLPSFGTFHILQQPLLFCIKITRICVRIFNPASALTRLFGGNLQTVVLMKSEPEKKKKRFQFVVPCHVCVCFCEISEIKTREKHANLLLSGAGGDEQGYYDNSAC